MSISNKDLHAIFDLIDFMSVNTRKDDDDFVPSKRPCTEANVISRTTRSQAANAVATSQQNMVMEVVISIHGNNGEKRRGASERGNISNEGRFLR